MTPTWERAPGPPSIEGAVFLETTLTPHRSLSRAAFRLMMGWVIAVNAAFAAYFLYRHAFPVAGFLGLDVAALWLAFHFNYRAAQRIEMVRVAKHVVYVSSKDASGGVKHYVLNPIWARVLRAGPGVLIRAGKAQMRLGAFLSPKECEALASELDTALWRAKR